jgi:hypothetical protein
MPAASILQMSSVISGFLPVLAALINYRHLDRVLLIAAVYFVISVMTDALLQIAAKMGVVNNYPILHVYIALSVVLLGAMYFNAFFSPILKKVIVIVSAAGLLVVVAKMIFMEGIMDYPSLSNTVLSFMIIIFSLLYFYQLLTRQEFLHVEKQGLFWINAGMLFYFAITIFLFMLFKRMVSAHQEGYYVINYITNIISNILFTVGLLCKPQKLKATSYQY